MMSIALLTATVSAGVHLDRVELLADDPGTFVYDELPLLAARPGGTALRAAAQVQPVLGFGSGLTLGVSMAALTPGYELEASGNSHGFGFLAAVPTRLGLPSGLVLAGTFRHGPLWVDLGVRATSGATWRTPRYGDLRVGPTLGVGWIPRGSRD